MIRMDRMECNVMPTAESELKSHQPTADLQALLQAGKGLPTKNILCILTIHVNIIFVFNEHG